MQETAMHGKRRFYSIDPQDDNTVDVYLEPDAAQYSANTGMMKHNVVILVVRGIVPWEGMENDIRARYDDWCASAELVGI